MRMSTFAIALCSLALPLLLLPATASSASSSKALEEAMGQDGLHKIKVKGIELVYAKPGASLANYKRVKIDPVEVAFHKSWDPTRTGSNIKVSSTERQQILDGVAKLVQEEFTRELQSKSGYAVTEETGDDVLRVKIHIVNLYVSAPGFLTQNLTPDGSTFVSQFMSAYGGAAPVPQAIFGYEAMLAVVHVLQQAGAQANNRSTVVHDFLAIRNRQSALGTYSINSTGDTSIAPFVFSRLQQDKLVPFAQVEG